jgi:hypothetical protein
MPKIIEEKIQKETPYHENTKIRKHERREGFYKTIGRFPALHQQATCNWQRATRDGQRTMDDGRLTND